ncbi:MAG: bifunctional UDP-N-acetylglucosamine diphosphorylase/glucosamine-1-phosphate N-acetyltransferase GlmU [Armatimonadetes bacterium]|nr:bifunctional UDP-N-acetylglucosamine diphosphorylase/glucosamine-1-phosphate N-acetyltransferase GlmU [Armatimonadota bacterium]
MSDQQIPCAAIILAAGKSTRMRSRLPKAIHPICGIPLTYHLIQACRQAGIERVIVVIGHQGDLVRDSLGGNVEYAVQAEQRGTGDAVKSALPLLNGFEGQIMTMVGDMPLLRAETLKKVRRLQENTSAALTMLSAISPDAQTYGRVVRGEDGRILRIVEYKDATEQERKIQEWNPSIYCFQAAALRKGIHHLRCDNVQGEYYLTDIVEILSRMGERVEAVPVSDSDEVMSINNRVELAVASRIMQQRILERWMIEGVTVVDPAETYVDVGVDIGCDTVLEPGTILQGDTHVGENCRLGPSSRIIDSVIGDGVTVAYSQIVESVVGPNCKIGPFAHLRPKSYLGANVKIGDFVELKASRLEDNVSASHLAYLGDAEVGRNANIGAGVITCNYDGQQKHRTTIGKYAFIGTDSALIAPITIGDGAFVAAGSIITEDVPPDALGIARARQVTKPNWAQERREKFVPDHQKEKGEATNDHAGEPE